MQGITLAIGILGSILAVALRPAYALAAYVGVLVWYPYYLRISIGTIDVSASRIVVIVLLLRCLCDSKILKRFVWSRLDKYVAFSMVVYVGIYCVTHPLQAAVENRGGFIMDTLFAYIAVRLIVRDRATLISFLKFTSVVLVALAILGVIESVTHWQPFLPLKRFRTWRVITADTIVIGTRWGFARATCAFNHPIMFGSCLIMFLPLIWSLRYQRGYWGRLAYPLSVMAAVGALSSMSSGPWVAGIATIFSLTMERFKRWVKPVLTGLILLCILAEIGSNRPLHYVLYDAANFGGGDYWQRVKLIDSAIRDFGEWWFAGYGGRDPGWGPSHADFTDANNEFIRAGIEYGLLGIIALCLVLVTAFRDLLHAGRQTTDVELKSLYWSLGSALVGVIVIWQGVSFFGQMPALFYSILGIIGSSVGFARYTKINSGTLLQASNSNLILAHGQFKQV